VLHADAASSFYTTFFTSPDLLPPVQERETFRRFFEPSAHSSSTVVDTRLLRQLFDDDLVARKCLQPAETRIGLQEVINIVEALEDQFSESVVGSVEDCMLCLVLLCLEMIRNGSSPILCCTVIMSSPAALGGQRTTRRPDVLPSHASASKVLSRPSGCLYIPQF